MVQRKKQKFINWKIKTRNPNTDRKLKTVRGANKMPIIENKKGHGGKRNIPKKDTTDIYHLCLLFQSDHIRDKWILHNRAIFIPIFSIFVLAPFEISEISMQNHDGEERWIIKG